jgi:hypothetical protein
MIHLSFFIRVPRQLIVYCDNYTDQLVLSSFELVVLSSFCCDN